MPGSTVSSHRRQDNLTSKDDPRSSKGEDNQRKKGLVLDLKLPKMPAAARRNSPPKLETVIQRKPDQIESKDLDLTTEPFVAQQLEEDNALPLAAAECTIENRTLPYALSQVLKGLSAAGVALVSAAYVAQDYRALTIAVGASVLFGFLGTAYGAQLLRRVGNYLSSLRGSK